MKILKNKTYQEIQSKLKARQEAMDMWHSGYNSAIEAKNALSLKLTAKEKECLDIQRQLQEAEKKLSALQEEPSAKKLAETVSAPKPSPSKKRSKK